MSHSRWVYRLADGMYVRGGFNDPEYDPSTEAVAEFQDADPHPNIREERANVPGCDSHDTGCALGSRVPASGREKDDFDLNDPGTKRHKALERLRGKKAARLLRASSISQEDIDDILEALGL